MTANLRLKPGRPTVDPDHRVCDACSCLPPSGDLPRLIRIPSWPAAERGSPYTEPDVECPTRSGDAEGNRTGSESSLRPAMPRPIRRWAPMCDRRSPLVWIVSSVRFLPVCTDSVPDASLGSLLGPDRVPLRSSLALRERKDARSFGAGRPFASVSLGCTSARSCRQTVTGRYICNIGDESDAPPI